MLSNARLLTETEPKRFLRRALLQLRWLTILALLLITITQPSPSTIGFSTWGLVVLFAGYNLLVELLRNRMPERFSFTWLAILDLPIAGLLYLLGAEAAGPLFVLFVLAVDSAAASLTLRGTLLYTAAVAVIAAAIDSTFPLWLPTPMDIRRLGARLIILVLVGSGMAILRRRLMLEQAVAQTVRDEAERLETLDKLRGEFVATVSHDLRTPLTAVRAGLGLLQTSGAGRLQPGERELLENARRNTERLGLLIDDLLTHNLLESGTLQLDPRLSDLRSVVMNAVSALYPLLREKGQYLEVDLPDPLMNSCDPRRMEQVIVNLVDNAHRHTPSGTHIRIAGALAESEVHISVSDDGPGIQASELEGIFERFHSLTPGNGGSGLGLAIVKSIVELHGGRIWAVSEPGQGASFHLVLPCAASAS